MPAPEIAPGIEHLQQPYGISSVVALGNTLLLLVRQAICDKHAQLELVNACAAFPFDFTVAFADTPSEHRPRYIMQSAQRVIAAVGIFSNVLPWLSVALIALPAVATEPGVRGYWQEPSGAVIEVAPCPHRLCLTLVALAPGEHSHTDAHNPDSKLRSRALCGLRIGQDFTEVDPQHAEGGHLYDPRSGQTYSGTMTAQGNKLKLRGYVGIQLLGRTEIWTRVGPGQASCPAAI